MFLAFNADHFHLLFFIRIITYTIEIGKLFLNREHSALYIVPQVFGFNFCLSFTTMEHEELVFHEKCHDLKQ